MTEMESLFTDQEENLIDPNKNYVEELVGDGKKFKTAEDLARSVMFKDQHIARLETETKGIREDLQARKKLEDLIEQLSSAGQTQQSTVNQHGSEADNTVSAIKPEDIEEIVEKKLSERQKQSRRDQNLDTVKRALQTQFGTNFKAKLREQADTLRVTEDFLNSVAAENPEAFYRLVGMNQVQQAPSATTARSSMNSAGMSQTVYGERTMKYYDNLKKTDPATYWKPKVQYQMHEDGIRLKDKFFDT